MDWRTLSLWDHQTASIRVIERYLRERRTARIQGSALVRMPTGTGKTGIIAVASVALYPSETALVVVPAKALRDQLERKIRSGFWEAVEADLDVPVEVTAFSPATVDAAIERCRSGRGTLVCTVQTLEMLHRPHRTGYGDREPFDRLREAVGYVLFDEGHREPSATWARAARALGVPVVLLSATPYRNDFALFDIDPKFRYTLRFPEALGGRYVRDVEVHEVPFDSPDAFAEALLAYYNGAYQEVSPGGAGAPRVIVRCGSMSSVREVTEALLARDVSAIGIHDRFESVDAGHLHGSVPDPAAEEATFWVHQFKLVEGIDDPRFGLVALYEPFSNARSVVQQVGRVIRNPTRVTGQRAVLFAHPGHKQRAFWEGYLAYEAVEEEDRVEPLALPRLWQERQPPVVYIDGDYRERFDPAADGAYLAFNYPRRANVRVHGEPVWNTELVGAEVADEWQASDRVVHQVATPDADTFVVIYTAVRNAPVLLDAYFYEIEVGFTIARRDGEFVFYYDSGGALAEAITEATKPVAPDGLSRLFPRGARTGALTLTNTDVSRNAVRRRSLHAYSMADIAPGVVDHAFFPSTVSATVRSEDPDGVDEGVGPFVSRYLGFARGRLSERTPRRHTYSDFVAWATHRAGILRDQGAAVDGLLRRYASYVEPGVDRTPTHVLLDIRDYLDADVYHHVETGEPLEIEDLAMDVTDGTFTVEANGEVFEVGLSYDSERHRYRLNGPDLDAAFTPAPAARGFRRGVVQQINIDQALRVVSEGEGVDPWTIYVRGQFYRPRHELDDRLALLEVFYPVCELAEVTTEKGATGSATAGGWAEGSVFHLIDNGGVLDGVDATSTELRDLLAPMDLLVCDDLQGEVADFIAADSANGRIAFIHAKAGDQPFSASAFHDVCSQAAKNLGLLLPSARTAPPNSVNLWGGEWNRGNGDIVDRRIRRGPMDAQAFWAQVQALIRNPTVEREVWVVYGGGFRLVDLRAQMGVANPQPQAIQLYYLLQSTWAAVSAAGARLRVFCPDHG